MRAGPGLRYAVLGPLETADLMGLDVAAAVMAYLLPDLDSSVRTPALIADLVKSGKLGVKSGGGIYGRAGTGAGDRLRMRDAALAMLLRGWGSKDGWFGGPSTQGNKKARGCKQPRA